jgi:hypothetical protein
VEVFIAGKDCYYEFEINALGTVYEVYFIWQDAYKKGSVFDKPEFDLLSQRVDVLGGFQDRMRFGKHPRGKRWAFNKHGVYDSHIPECFTFVHFSTKTEIDFRTVP